MRAAALALTLATLLVACAGMEPFEPPVTGELNPEPGLFSGENGAFILYRSDRQSQPAEKAEPERRLTDPPPI